MKSKILVVAFVLSLVTTSGLFAQSKIGRKIDKTTRDIEKTENVLNQGKKLLGKILKKNKNTDEDVLIMDKGDFYVEFTIEEEYFLLDASNNSNWVTLHVDEDTENEYLSMLKLYGIRYGTLDGGPRGSFGLTLVPKDRHLKNKEYVFKKGSDMYDPMAFFYFDNNGEIYEMAKPNEGSYVHEAGGSITILQSENTVDGVVEGTFVLENVMLRKKKQLVAENKHVEGKFRLPVSIGPRMSN